MHSLESAAPASLDLIASPQPVPYRRASEHLADHLRLAALHLQRHLVRHSQRLLDGAGSLDDTAVCLQEVLGTLRRASGLPGAQAPAGWPEEQHLQQQILGQRRWIQERLEATVGELDPCSLPLEALRGAFQLSERELLALVLASAPGLSVSMARLVRFAVADFSTHGLPLGVLAELLQEDPEDLCGDMDGLGPVDTLRRCGLLELGGDPLRFALERPLAPPRDVLAALRGGEAALPAWCQRQPCAQAPQQVVLESSQTWGELRRALRQASRGGVVVLTGEEGVGRRSALSCLLASAGQPLLLAQGWPAQQPEALQVALRQARLAGCGLLLRAQELEGEPLLALARWLGEAVQGARVPVVLTCRRASAALLRSLEASVVSFARCSPPRQREVWRLHLEAQGAQAPEAVLEELSARLDLTPGQIGRAVEQAQRQGQGHSQGWLAAARAQLQHGLGELAQELPPGPALEAVVLPEGVRRQVCSLLDHVRLGERVLQGWGLAQSAPGYGRGVACLLSGPPGTGKTLLARSIAAELGRPLHRVDLSQVVSKYIGESEKNLARLLEEAERAQVVLLFDEADSLFGKRTEVKSGQDRYANLEVNYLLQRLESFQGVAFLTTNLETGVDEAFLRRLRFHLRLELPDVAHRARLWEAFLPPRAPICGNICFQTLAQLVEMTGGHIRNAVMRACFAAAGRGEGICMEDLMEAAVDEARQSGRLVCF